MSKQEISVTVDAVIIYKVGLERKLLLIQRQKEPYKDKWALPGGFLENEEPPVKGAHRELQEETGLQVEKLWQIGAFGDPQRDPRGRIISIAFLGVTTQLSDVEGKDDAGDAKWFDLLHLPDLAFDHEKIINAAINML